MKTLKIAMVTGAFPTVSETFVVNQILALQKAGHQVDVYCFKINAHLLKQQEKPILKNAKVLGWQHHMPKSYLSRTFKILAVLFKALKKGLFKSFLKELFFSNKTFINTHAFFKHYSIYYFAFENYQVLHIHFGTNAVQLIAQLQHFPNKKVVTFHGFDAHKYPSDYYEDLITTNNICYTVNSQYTKQKILQLGFPDQHISILPVGLDTSFFKPNKKAHVGFNILFIGRFIELKAPLLAIKILEKLIIDTTLQIHLYMIGEGEEYHVCQEYVKSKNLKDNISILGNKSQNEIRDYMNNSDVFLFPGVVDKQGRREAQGLVLQEAQAMELPVIISNVGGMKEGIIDGETGFVVIEKDMDAFVERLLFLIRNTKEQKAMGQKGREFVKKHFDNGVLGIQLLDIYIKN